MLLKFLQPINAGVLIGMGIFLLSGCKPTVTLSRSALADDQTLKITISKSAYSLEEFISIEGEKVRWYETPDGISWRALVAIPFDSVPGKKSYSFNVFYINKMKATPFTGSFEIIPSTHPHETLFFSKSKKDLLNNPAEQKESALILDALRKADTEKTQYWEGKFIKPLPGELLSPFGIQRTKVGQLNKDYHKGIDLAGKVGEPIAAANAGKIILTEKFIFHGNTVLIDHGQGVATIYLHMRSIDVAVGDIVKKAQKIGEVGSTGLSTAPHLHWGLYVHGRATNPLHWIEEEF